MTLFLLQSNELFVSWKTILSIHNQENSCIIVNPVE